MNWREYWNRDTPIYAGERHKLLHYRLVANDIANLVPARDAVVLDHGCGEALSADRIAARCARLYLCDAAPLVRGRLQARFGNQARILVIAPEEIDRIADGALDLVVVNSLIQYLSLEELRRLLAVWRAKLKPTGKLVLADVIPPDVSPLTDAQALVAFAWQGGFLTRALVGLVRTALSDYRAVRDELGLAQYGEAEVIELLRDSGFSARRRPRNIGHNQARMTFEATPV
jgi:SAM-dependent methyltransferase